MALILYLALQEDLDATLEKLGDRVTHATLAELLKSEAGRLVVKERIAFLADRMIARYDRDPMTWYERWLFDDEMKLRPERKPEVERLLREKRRREKAFADFDRRATELVGRIRDGEMESRLKKAWLDPTFRLALFQRIPAEARDVDSVELFHQVFGKALYYQRDGKVRCRGPYRDEVLGTADACHAEVDAYDAMSEQVEEARAKLKLQDSPPLRLLIAAHLAAGETDPDARAIQGELAAITKIREEIRPHLEYLAARIPEDTDVEKRIRRVLREEKALTQLLIRIRLLATDRKAATEGAFAMFEDDAFENGAVKPGRFENVDALQAEIDGLYAEFAGMRAMIDDVAERATDPAVVEAFESKIATMAVFEYLFRAMEEMKEAVRDSALDLFLQTYLIPQGNKYALRPERAARVEAWAKRAAEIRKEIEK